MTTTTQRPQHAKPRREPRIANVVKLRHPTNGRVLKLNADEREFVATLLACGYEREGKALP